MHGSSPKEDETHPLPPSVFYYEDYRNSVDTDIELLRPRWAGPDFDAWIERRLTAVRSRGLESQEEEHDVARALQQEAINFSSLAQKTVALINRSLTVTKWKEIPGYVPWSLRVYPSSGALYGTEAYFRLGDDVLHFDAESAALRKVGPGGTTRAAGAARPHPPRSRAAGQLPAAAAACSAVFLTTTWQRQTYKYGERGFRYSLLDAGHVLAALEFAAWRVGLRLVQASGHCAAQVRTEKAQLFLGMFHLVDADAVEVDLHLEKEPDQAVTRLDAACGCQPLAGGTADLADGTDFPISNSKNATATLSLLGDTDPAAPDFYLSRFLAYPSVVELISAMRILDGAVDVGDATSFLPFDSDPFAAEFNDLTATQTDALFGRLTHGRRTATGFVRGAAPLSGPHFHFFLRLLSNPGRDVLFFVHSVEAYAPGVYLLERRTRTRSSPSHSASGGASTTSTPGEGEADNNANFRLLQPTTSEQARVLGQNAACGQEIGGGALRHRYNGELGPPLLR